MERAQSHRVQRDRSALEKHTCSIGIQLFTCPMASACAWQIQTTCHQHHAAVAAAALLSFTDALETHELSEQEAVSKVQAACSTALQLAADNSVAVPKLRQLSRALVTNVEALEAGELQESGS